MNKNELPPSTLLFAGEIFDGHDEAHQKAKLADGSLVDVRVRIVPSRHLTAPSTGWLDLFETGREAERLQLAVQRKVDAGWAPADADFIDGLDSECHVRLLAEDHRLNFHRAISQAERNIAHGTELIPLKERLAATLVKPLETAFQSLISSATTQLCNAVAAKKP